jgi:hypothetical protein
MPTSSHPTLCLAHNRPPSRSTTPGRVRRYLEAGEYGEAILQCAEAFQLLEGPLTGLTVAPQLQARVQRHYFDSLQRLDAALLRCCSAFSAEGYSKVQSTRTGTERDAAWPPIELRRPGKAPGLTQQLCAHASFSKAGGAMLTGVHPVLAGPSCQVLEGYLLQGIAPAALAAKVVAAFKDAVHDAAIRVVRLQLGLPWDSVQSDCLGPPAEPHPGLGKS